MKQMIKNYFPEITGAFFCLTLGMLSGYLAHNGDTSWYQTLSKPDFNPPAWIFAPVWTILYIMMGWALGKIIKTEQNQTLRILFSIQFTCNLVWSFLFFRMHRIDLALYDITGLLITLFALIITARHHKSIIWLLLPYFTWTAFALILNFKIYLMNV